MTNRNDVYAALDSERDYQEMRKQRDDGQPFHSVEEFLLYMEDYLHEARSVASRTWGPDAKPKTLEVLRKVVALGVACMEIHGAPQRAGFERDRDQPTRQIVLDIGHALKQLEENPELGEKMLKLVMPEANNVFAAAEKDHTEFQEIIAAHRSALWRIAHEEHLTANDMRAIAERILTKDELAHFMNAPAPVQPPAPIETYDVSSTLTREEPIAYVPPAAGERMGPDDDEIPF